MCTSIAMKNGDFYFGRNMDIDYDFGERVVVTPRYYPFKFRFENVSEKHFALIGMASLIDNYPLYAEAANEKGLCMAGLNFPDNAYYTESCDNNKYNISVFELIPWILGKCSCIKEAKQLIEKTNIIDEAFKNEIPSAPLHWHISDKNKSIVLECMKNGVRVYDNPVNVLTNNPPFDFHLTNLSQYVNLTVALPESHLCRTAHVKPFGKGFGSFGLPGDFSPASRFVKTAYLLTNSVCENEENKSVSQFFHILDSAAVVNGSIEADSDKPYFTTYSCCINADKGIYYYKTYWNNQISSVEMNNVNLDTNCLAEVPIIKSQQIKKIN